MELTEIKNINVKIDTGCPYTSIPILRFEISSAMAQQMKERDCVDNKIRKEVEKICKLGYFYTCSSKFSDIIYNNESIKSISSLEYFMEQLTVNGKEYIILKMLGKGDVQKEIIVKEYINGKTVYEMVLDDELPIYCIDQVKKMCGLLYPANTNIDYFPTNFVLQDHTLYYIDYECNDYMDEWNFENWGMKYWSKTSEFLQYVEDHQ